MQDKNFIKLTDQDAALLEQGASMLEGLENDERNRGNCSTAEGAGCSAHAVRRLASALLAHEREIDQCLHQIQEPAAAEQAAWHAGLDEGRAQAAPAAVAVPDERAAFEAWAKSEDMSVGSDCDGYIHANTAAASQAWQARAALAATPVAAPMAKGYDSGIQTGNRVTLIFETQDAATAWFESFSDAYDAENGTRSIALPIPISTTAAVAGVDKSPELQGSMVDKTVNLQGAAAAPVVLPEPAATIYTMEALVPGGSVKHHAEVHKALPAGTKLFAEPEVRALLAGVSAPAAQAVELFGYVNTHTGQFFKDVEPCRKTNEGHWRTVFTAPQTQADARDAESDYQRGYRHGYNRRDAEVQGALL